MPKVFFLLLFLTAAGAQAQQYRIVLPPLSASEITLRRDTFDRGRQPAERLPSLQFSLWLDGESIVPISRRWVESGGEYWDYAVGDGYAAGEGWHIALSLLEKDANCVHDANLSLSPEDGEVILKVETETCAYYQFRGSYRGRAVIEAEPASPARPGRLPPLRSLAALKSDYPQIDTSWLGNPAEKLGEAASRYGLVVGEVQYSSGCGAEPGADPLCASRALPSYSLAKSLAAGVGLMRLERLAPGISRVNIDQLVPQCAQGWEDVALAHLLNMTSGHYRDSGYMADEDAPHIDRLLRGSDHAGKIAYACGFPRRVAPGKHWVYQTASTYLLGTGMQFVWRDLFHGGNFYREGIYDPLFRPAGVSPLLARSRQTRDEAAQPYFGWGLFLLESDVAALSRWLADEAREWLDPAMLDAALQRTKEPAGSIVNAEIRYSNGFWAYDVSGKLGCREPLWVPFLSGYGGITVALYPNGVTYYYFSDGYRYDWLRSALAADAVSPLCGKR